MAHQMDELSESPVECGHSVVKLVFNDKDIERLWRSKGFLIGLERERERERS